MKIIGNKLTVTMVQDDGISSFQLSVKDAYDLVQELVSGIKVIAEKQANSLAEQIIEHKELRSTIFQEAVNCEHFISDIEILKIPLRLLGNNMEDKK